MDIQYVLLSPKGRIGPRTFLRGLILLTGGYMLCMIAEAFLSPEFGVLTFPMIYMYVCVFSKRLHDAGQSGWLYLLFLLGYVVVFVVSNGVLMPVLSPEANQLYAELLQLLLTGDNVGAQTLMEANEKALVQGMAITSLSSFLIASAVLATIGARLTSDPDPNRYGPPPGIGPANTFS